VPFALPDLRTAAEATAALGEITRSVAIGDTTPAEAADLAKRIDGFTRALDGSDFEVRITALETRRGGKE